MRKTYVRSRHKGKKPSVPTRGAPPEAAAKNAVPDSAAQTIGARLRELRIQRKMSQGDIEEKAGLLRCYISRVENGWTVPSVETLEKFAAALAVPLHLLFYTGKGAPEVPALVAREAAGGASHRDPLLGKLRRLIAKMDSHDRQTLVNIVRKLTVLRG